MEIAMFKKLFFAFTVLFLAACAATPTSVPTLSANQIDIEEQAVYTAVLQEMFSASSFVIMDTTATDPGGVENTTQTLDYVQQNMHGMAPEIVDSFRVRNEAAYSIRPDMDLGVEYVLLSQAEKNQIFGQNQSGWEIFYNRYPNAPGITTLSRVGFNAALDQALVYLGTQSDWLAGAGYYILLKKANGVWTIDQKVMTWIS
jgi:hypothetical protein